MLKLVEPGCAEQLHNYLQSPGRTGVATGLTPKAVLESLGAIQVLDVCFPTTAGRWLVMPRYTQPEPEQHLLLHRLKLSLPPQPPPKLRARSTEFPAAALRL